MEKWEKEAQEDQEAREAEALENEDAGMILATETAIADLMRR
jgi:hypothetical protein